MADKRVGLRVRQRRKELGITQDELCKIVGFTDRSSISKIENGERDVTREKLMPLAEALQTTPEYILGLPEKEDVKLTEKETAFIEAIRRHEELHDVLRKLLDIDEED